MGSCVSQTSTGCAAVPGQVSEPREVGPRVCSVAVAPVRLDRKPQGATRSLGRYLPVSNLDVQLAPWPAKGATTVVYQKAYLKSTPKAPWVPAVDRDL